ncbi:MAG: 16S rRNA (cytidine(1402)-2'-O)-methyltransferase [Hydrogenophaga sp.]|uniref:16S rRNA (cytidine(1402)-2'-O)-methyltransferase n=1 Tax=Hydrogenophaga sp. TaxID=1904254 RepID=UPI0025C13FD9|nr:16S rRNA (cytidine(1402)-2'-O)-methyltransferase [Hydrogenophaga sp.]MDP2075126.1 16S rRNA (cytidine(1402)-2'-O)-methyltransferase [Hydrogenophaga sp.]MDP2988733.1 16S rRNA (cytidine(1402)-2'-O)-methyltransferase [Hydrogenophaga sp.]MDP3110114.1 16S rRNA (cytidine(1402)-2'-O)-methyltransferase [Hydrogenophaga sp.]MDP3203935.1 16S rRNA (cytidine(1402)-2'-O)-methyltransferase [Hydrogenophaga sp.]MDP3626184.1 16S rRNA (cytidine(1402)-2'-O)-methyltransferase [Hydrogenophaga sp.]
MSASSPSLLAAARDAAAHQHYPQGALYMVATPIGNLADIGLRALQVLSLVDTVACEDTRHTAALLQGYGLHKPLLALHEHNEAEAAQTVVQRLQAGQRVAYVSDAGTPGVSDPGARLVAAVNAAGLRSVPIPGASSITALLSVSGTVAGMGGWDGRFVFAGFLASKAAERQREVQLIGADARGCVLLEAPHRIEALAKDLGALGERMLTVGRELTKQFEEVAHLKAQDFGAWLQANTNRTRGEFVLLVHPQPATAEVEGSVDATALRTLDVLLKELPLKTAVKLCAEITGQPRNALYDAALARRQGGSDD